jgi:hypothetical protein
MPIPAFDGITRVLPPYLGEIARRDMVSPYPCTLPEVARALGATPERKAILAGFPSLRRDLRALGVTAVQWLDGSFVEDKEALVGKAPGDIDVVTFAAGDLTALRNSSLLSRKHVRQR